MRKFLNFLLMFLVLTPLSVFQTALPIGAVTLWLADAPDLDVFARIVITLFLILLPLCLINLLVMNIRFGWGECTVGLFFSELLCSPIRVLLQLIADLIFIVSIFTGWDVDPHEDPTYESGFVNVILRFTLFFSIDSFEFGSTPSDFFDEDRVYKIKNIFYQFFILVLTLIHSGLLIYGLFVLDWVHTVFSSIEPFFVVVGYVVLYFFAMIFSALMKGVVGTGEYYDPEQVTLRTDYYQKTHTFLGIYNRYLYSDRKVIKEAGWKSYLTLGMIVYMIMSPLWFIPQLITFLLSVVIPAHCGVCPCRAKDADIDDEPNFSGRKTFHMFFGLANSYDIDKG